MLYIFGSVRTKKTTIQWSPSYKATVAYDRNDFNNHLSLTGKALEDYRGILVKDSQQPSDQIEQWACISLIYSLILNCISKSYQGI